MSSTSNVTKILILWYFPHPYIIFTYSPFYPFYAYFCPILPIYTKILTDFLNFPKAYKKTPQAHLDRIFTLDQMIPLGYFQRLIYNYSTIFDVICGLTGNFYLVDGSETSCSWPAFLHLRNLIAQFQRLCGSTYIMIIISNHIAPRQW